MSAAKLKSVKDDAMAIQDYLADLQNWEKDIKKEDKRLLALQKQGHPEKMKDPALIRCPQMLSNSKDDCIENESQFAARGEEPKKRVHSSDYAAWDKYDADAAVESIEKQASKQACDDGNKCLPTTSQDRSPTNTEATDEDKLKAIQLKDEGNQLFSAGQYSSSVTKYSQGLDLDPSNHILYANRAMAYIKLEQPEAAVRDCDASLRLSPNYLKAWLRRGAARLSLGLLQHALEDYQKVLEVEPWNKDAKQKVSDIKKRIMFPYSESTKSNTRRVGHSSLTTSVSSKDKEQKTSENSARRDQLASAARLGSQTLPATDPSKAAGQQSSPLNTDPDILQPACKPLHMRSQKPLKKLPVVDVASEEDIPPFKLPKQSGDRDEIGAQTSTVLPQSSPSSSETGSKKFTKSFDDTAPKSPSRKNPASSVTPKTPTKSSESSSPGAPQLTPSRTDVTSSLPAGTFSTPTPPLPRTSHQFMSSWSKMALESPRAFAWLQSIKPSTIRGFELEVDCIASMVSTFSSWLSPAPQPCETTPPSTTAPAVLAREPANVRQMARVYLEAVTESRSFELNALFLTTDDKTRFLSLLSDLESDLDGLSPRLTATRQLLTT